MLKGKKVAETLKSISQKIEELEENVQEHNTKIKNATWIIDRMYERELEKSDKEFDSTMENLVANKALAKPTYKVIKITKPNKKAYFVAEKTFFNKAGIKTTRRRMMDEEEIELHRNEKETENV